MGCDFIDQGRLLFGGYKESLWVMGTETLFSLSGQWSLVEETLSLILLFAPDPTVAPRLVAMGS